MAKPEVFRRAARLRVQARQEKEWLEKLGTVTAYTFGANDCTVLFDGEDATEDPDDSVQFKRTYLPNVGDRVLVRKIQGRRVIDSVIGVPPTVKAWRNAGFSVLHATWGLMSWDMQSWNSVAALHSTSTNPSRLIAPSPGIWLLRGQVMFDHNGVTQGNDRMVKIVKNGAGNQAAGTNVLQVFKPANATGGGYYTSVPFEIESMLTTNDYLEVFWQHRQGGGITINGTPGEGNTFVEFEQRFA